MCNKVKDSKEGVGWPACLRTCSHFGWLLLGSWLRIPRIPLPVTRSPVTRIPDSVSRTPELTAFMEITFLQCCRRRRRRHRRSSRRCRCCYSSKCKYFSFLLRKLSNVFKNVRRMRNLFEYVCAGRVRLYPHSLFGFQCKSEMQGF